MTKATKIVLYSLCIWIVCLAIASQAPAEDRRFRARIGLMVRSGDRNFQAKSHDKLNPGDMIRIYVHPEKRSFVYLIHADRKARKVNLLSMTEQRVQPCMLVLPSVYEYYQVDGNSDAEVFTVICSPGPMHEFAGEQLAIDYEKWVTMEKDLVERSSLRIAETIERPFPIIGNVRSLEIGSDNPPVPIFSGKDFLVKRFEFEVRKP